MLNLHGFFIEFCLKTIGLSVKIICKIEKINYLIFLNLKY